jgi:hypothetical protein
VVFRVTLTEIEYDFSNGRHGRVQEPNSTQGALPRARNFVVVDASNANEAVEAAMCSIKHQVGWPILDCDTVVAEESR